MKGEFLFPEMSNLYGDPANFRYLEACLPDAEWIRTDNRSTPRFATEQIDFLYLGSMPEDKQVLAAERLRPYTDALRRQIETGTVILATGNACELFGEYIADADKKTPMLGLYPFHAERNLEKRINCHLLGSFEDIKIVGYKSQFSVLRGEFPGEFIRADGGMGNAPGDRSEGFRDRNFFGTYLLGPLLVLNPLFTKYLLRLLKQEDRLAFEKEALEAYECRLKQLEAPNAVFPMGEHG